MIIVKRRSEVIRFLLFLVAVGLMAYYVASRWEAWHLARQGNPTDGPATAGAGAGTGRDATGAGVTVSGAGQPAPAVGRAGSATGKAAPAIGQAGAGAATRQSASTIGQAEASPGPILGAPQGEGLADTPAAPEADFFAEFRMQREQNRSALQEKLKEVMESPASGAETRESAGAQYLALGRQAALEVQAEALVRARGFEDAVVHLSSEGSAQVVVKVRNLTQQQAVQVVDTVSRVTGVKAGAVQVMARER